MIVVDNEAIGDGLPSAAFLHVFDEQNTRELHNEARRFAKLRVRYVRNVGQPVPRNYATELVNDALIDTRLRIARWNPARCTLLIHICGVIRARTAREIRRGRQFPRVPIRVVGDDITGGHSRDFSKDFSDVVRIEDLPDRASSPVAFIGLVFRVASELKMIAHGDANAQMVLDCWQVEIIERDAVMARTGMTLASYKATRKRLLFLAKRLPSELREAAREALRSVS